MTLLELQEQIQEDLLTLTDGYLIDELDGYEDFDRKMCDIIINNFNRYKPNCTDEDEASDMLYGVDNNQ